MSEQNEQEQIPVEVKVVGFSELDKEWIADVIEKVIEAKAAYATRLLFLTIGWVFAILGAIATILSIFAGLKKFAPFAFGIIALVAGVCLLVGFWKTKRNHE